MRAPGFGFRCAHDAEPAGARAESAAVKPLPLGCGALPEAQAAARPTNAVRPLGDDQWEVSRPFLGALLAALAFGDEVDLQPRQRAGGLDGVEVRAVRAGGTVASLGVEPGDIVRVASGRTLDREDAALDLVMHFTELAAKGPPEMRIVVEIERGGAQRKLTYHVKPEVHAQPRPSGPVVYDPTADELPPWARRTAAFAYHLDGARVDLAALHEAMRRAPVRRRRERLRGGDRGIRLEDIAEASPLHTIGLRSGDVLRTVNGESLHPPEIGEGLWTRLWQPTVSEIRIERRGVPLTLRYVVARAPAPVETETPLDGESGDLTRRSVEVERATLEPYIEDPARLAEAARTIPHYRGGERQGTKFVGVRPGSVYARLGIRSGDVLLGATAPGADGLDGFRAPLMRLVDTGAATVVVERRGRRLQLEWRTRYLAFYCWAWREFLERFAVRTPEGLTWNQRAFNDWMKRQEWWLVAASRLDDAGQAHVGGSTRADVVLARAPTSVGLHTDYLKAAHGSLRDYRSTLRALGLIGSDDDGAEVPTAAGHALGAAFGAAADACGFAPHLEDDVQPLDRLRAYGRACAPHQLSTSAAELELLRAQFLRPPRRRAHVCLLLRLAERIGDGVMAFRRAVYLGVDAQDRPLGLPPAYDGLLDQWWVYQARDTLTFGLEAMLRGAR